MKSTLKLIGIGLAALLSGPVVAQAAVIDVTAGVLNGTSTTLTMPEATITAGAGTTLLVGDFVANAVCPLGNFGCNGLMTLVFNFDVTNVSFDYGFGNNGDSAQLSVFDGLGGFLGLFGLNSTAGVAAADLSAFGTMRTIVFDNSAATGAGYAYGDINYRAVPLPSMLPLMLTGLGAVALFLRKSRA